MGEYGTTSESHGMAELTLQPGQFETLRDILARYSGVFLDETSQRSLVSGLSHRMVVTGLSFSSYIAHISRPAGRAELQEMCELVLNHETVFFRNQPHMRALREVILPRVHRRKPSGEPLRIWSAGCSTGEEPYSVAITALETLGRSLPRPVEIWATDLSEPALIKARVGRYHGRTMSNVTPALKKRYFDYRGRDYIVRDEVRTLIHFEQFNLLHPIPEHLRGVDIIFCQNVTIYFDLETFRALVDRFYHILPDWGLLFLGFSETLWNIYDKFRLEEVAGAFVYVKEPESVRANRGAAATTAPSPAPKSPATAPDVEHPHRPPAPRVPSIGPTPPPTTTAAHAGYPPADNQRRPTPPNRNPDRGNHHPATGAQSAGRRQSR